MIGKVIWLGIQMQTDNILGVWSGEESSCSYIKGNELQAVFQVKKLFI